MPADPGLEPAVSAPAAGDGPALTGAARPRWVRIFVAAGLALGLLLLGAAGGLAVAPVASAISRWAEARADWVALEVTRDPATAVAVERRLALENRADLRPNRLLVVMFASHPSTMARIAQAWLWAERH
jgi:STE24 endopeptidase